MTKQYQTISFLSDYGLRDEFVGVTKSVIHSIAPHTTVIDITHEVPAYDVRSGSLTLVRAANYLVAGVVIAVVDPGVGSARRAIAVEVGDGESVLVGPDNGLLAPVVSLIGGPTRIVELVNEKYQLTTDAATFAGRDIFGPAAAHICNGVDLAEFGPSIDASELMPAVVPFSAVSNGSLEADVLWVDRYGNVQLNVTPNQLSDYGDRIVVKMTSGPVTATRARAFADLASGEAGLLIDASGLAALVLNQDSAAARYSVAEGDSVSLHRPL